MKQITTDIPARLDRLPWSRFHWLVLLGLGTVWVLDGLEVTIVGVIGPRLTSDAGGLMLTDSEVGLAAGIYVLGACIGALFFGHLTDRYGRKKLFLATLAVYLAATVATAFSFEPWYFFLCRFFTGAGIGGEYAAINSAIDELIPARLRGRVDLIINGSYWLGTVFGALVAIPLLNPEVLPEDIGWRVLFGLGAILGIGILLIRRLVPESPRWLFIHGKDEEAERIVTDIERSVHKELPKADRSITVNQRDHTPLSEVAVTLMRKYPRRTVVGLSLFIGQAFLYNSIFFTYALVLAKFFGVPDGSTPWYLIPIAIGNFLGPLLLGHFFDSIGRRPMIAGSYVLSGLLLVGTALLFDAGSLDATTLTICWMVVFFFASAGASSAYLTVSEIFPMETRALAIALFYAVGTGLGGIIGPILFGRLVESEQVGQVTVGYLIGAALMIAAGLVQWFLGIEAARRSLEDIAEPLSAQTVDRAQA
ncbi:MFS transporter [Herbidospora mongoliensis]|uniref:MFS transporter n=1 Tax=Herbidospora mongoliensis TaxID=688067 RepID=UPI000A963C23|nr:MFS transporter [Herbidospora mongoliensis]